MRVCLLNDSFPPMIDGVSNTVFNYATFVQKDFGDAVVLTPAYPHVTDDYPFEVIRYPSLDMTRFMDGYRTGLPLDAKTHYRISKNPPDIIHSHCPMVSGVLARALKEETGAPLIGTYHTKFDEDLKRVLHNPPLEKIACRAIVDNMSACDEVWAVSEGAGENLRSLGYQGDYRVMPNGVDFPLGSTKGPRTEKLRAGHGIPESVPVFIFVGRMVWYKGQRLILDALRELKDEGFDFRMVFIGGGENKEDVEKYADVQGLADNCIFTGPILDRELLRDYFSMSSMLLFPSEYDTNGIVVREAAACGLGSVLIRNSCAAEGIRDGREALLCEPDARDMANRLREMVRDPAQMSWIGKMAQNDIYISWEDAVTMAHARYEVLLEEKKAGRLTGTRSVTTEMLALNAEMQASMNRIFRTQEKVRLQMNTFRKNYARRVLRDEYRARFRMRAMRREVEKTSRQLKVRARWTYRGFSSLRRRILEEIERYL